MKTLDMKSCLLGATIGIAAAAMIGASNSSPTSPGRFQVAVNEGGVGLVIDTATGQVWRHTGLASVSSEVTFFRPKLPVPKE